MRVISQPSVLPYGPYTPSTALKIDPSKPSPSLQQTQAPQVPSPLPQTMLLYFRGTTPSSPAPMVQEVGNSSGYTLINTTHHHPDLTQVVKQGDVEMERATYTGNLVVKTGYAGLTEGTKFNGNLTAQNEVLLLNSEFNGALEITDGPLTIGRSSSVSGTVAATLSQQPMEVEAGSTLNAAVTLHLKNVPEDGIVLKAKGATIFTEQALDAPSAPSQQNAITVSYQEGYMPNQPPILDLRDITMVGKSPLDITFPSVGPQGVVWISPTFDRSRIQLHSGSFEVK